MWKLLAAAALLAGCMTAPAEPDAEVCHFPSGRPCEVGTVCLGEQGDECNYYTCQDGALTGTAIGCSGVPADWAPPVPGGPFDCDPGAISEAIAGVPPRSPCPLGALQTIVDGTWGQCVPVEQCEPLPCDPAYAGDGCPSGHTCDAATLTCARV